MLTILPREAAPGSAGETWRSLAAKLRLSTKGAVELTAMTSLSHSSVICVYDHVSMARPGTPAKAHVVDRSPALQPGAIDEDASGAEGEASVDEAVELAGVGEVAEDEVSLAALGANGVDGLGVVVDLDADDRSAGGGELGDDGQADVAVGACSSPSAGAQAGQESRRRAPGAPVTMAVLPSRRKGEDAIWKTGEQETGETRAAGAAAFPAA
jgi:hypothetical protein